MMPDRIRDPRNLGANPTRPAGQNPYAVARKKPAGAVLPVRPDPGQTQPQFAVEPSMGADPLDGAPARAAIFASRPRGFMGPGAEDIAQDKFSQDFSHGRAMNAYQTPMDYEMHQAEVMNSPLMKQMADGIAQEKQLREDYLRNAPAQPDMSPVMALADYLAKGKGTAQQGYHKPASYEDVVANLRGMLGQEQKDRYNMTQLATEQTGGLKSGTEETVGKTGVDQGRAQGYKIPHPPLAGLNQPFNQFQQIGKAYEDQSKHVNDTIRNALEMRKQLANPSWYTSNLLSGTVVKNIAQRTTQTELFLLGGGSTDVLSQVQRAVQKAQNGDKLLPSDRHAMAQFNELELAGAIKARDQIKGQMIPGYSGVSVLPDQKIGAAMGGRDVPIPDAPAGKSEDDRALDFARQFFGSGK
jgi:hypothetical protein